MNDPLNPMIMSNVAKFSTGQETETTVKLNGTIFVGIVSMLSGRSNGIGYCDCTWWYCNLLRRFQFPS